MSKALYRRENDVFLKLLKEKRLDSGLTQAQCSDQLGRPQSFMSDVETGSRRIDIIQLRDLCGILGISLPEFTEQLEMEINKTS